MSMKAVNFLPQLLRRRAREWESSAEQGQESPRESFWSLEKILAEYGLPFTFFSKVDAWRAYQEIKDHELWVLERVGWAEWKGATRLLYCMEGITIPELENSEIVTVNSISPPFLTGAHELEWSEEILAEAVQVGAIEDLPEALRLKVSLHMPRFLRELADTLLQMEVHKQAFNDYVKSRIDEYVEKVGERQQRKLETIETYFKHERRVELFHDFMEKIHQK